MRASERLFDFLKLFILYLLLVMLIQPSTNSHADSQHPLSTDGIISYEIANNQLQLIIGHEIIDEDAQSEAKYHIGETSTGKWTDPIGVGEQISPSFFSRPTFLGHTNDNGAYLIFFFHENEVFAQEYLPKVNEWTSPVTVITKADIANYLPIQYRDKGSEWEPSIRPIIFQRNENNSHTLGWSFFNRNFDDDFNNKPFICTFNPDGSISFKSEMKDTKFLYEFTSDSFIFEFNNQLSFYLGYYRNYYTYKDNQWIEIDEIKDINSRVHRVSRLEENIIESHQIADVGSINSHWIHKEVVLRVISDKSGILNISVPFDPIDLRYYEISNIIAHNSLHYVATYDRAKFQILQIDLNQSIANIVSEFQYVDDVYDLHRYPQQLELISRENGFELYWSQDIYDESKRPRWSEIFKIGLDSQLENWTPISQITYASLFTNDYIPSPDNNRISFGVIPLYSSLVLITFLRKKTSQKTK